MNIWSYQIRVLIFFSCIPRSGIVGSYGSSIFSFLRSLHIAFHFPPYCGCTNSYSNPTMYKGSLSSTYSPTSVFVVFLMIAILTGVKWYLIMVFDLHFFDDYHVEHLFFAYLPICLLRKNVYSNILSIIFIEVNFFFWCWVIWAVYIFWTLIS